MSVFSTTGVWADTDPREAVSRGVSAVEAWADAAVPFPLMAQPAGGGTRWAVDALGLAAQLMPELPTDIGPAGWRLLGAHAAPGARSLDARREASRLGRAVDALSEYSERSGLPVLVSVPGPWTLVRRLGLPDESPVLGDRGARRDVIQAYAAGLQELRERLGRIVGEGTSAEPSPLIRLRLVEDDLDAILTGAVPTVSGYRTLPAVPDAQVTAALRSLIARTGPDTILSLPRAASVRIGGKEIAHTQLAREAGVTALAVGGLGSAPREGSDVNSATSPASNCDASAVRRWERLAGWTETGGQLWLRIPAGAASTSHAVAGWVDAVRQPWEAVGMNRAGLAGFGILTGEELPVGGHPLLPEASGPERSRTHLRMAEALSRAFTDQAA